jgi:hypothetical protein
MQPSINPLDRVFGQASGVVIDGSLQWIHFKCRKEWEGRNHVQSMPCGKKIKTSSLKECRIDRTSTRVNQE